jgi:protein involved in ribonucleotide reduction
LRYDVVMMTKRKRRNDTTHYIYVLTNTATNEQYVGITVKNPGGVKQTLRRRVQKHVQRSLTENKNWALCEAIRKFGSEAFTYGLLETVRGRVAAHGRERELIREHSPALNTV